MKKSTKIISVMLAVALLVSVCTSLFAAPASAAYTFSDKVSAVNATKTTNASGTTYVCDFKAADGTLASGSDYKTSSNSTVEVSEGGLNYTTSTPGNVDEIKYNVEAYVGDPDFGIGTSTKNRVVLEAGHYYEVTVEWKSTTASGAPQIYIGHGYNSKGLNNESRFIDVYAGTLNTDMTTTVVIDGDTTGTDAKNKNYAVAGNYLCLGAGAGDQILFKNVTITVYDKEAFTVAENQLAVNFDNGLNDVYLPNGDSNKFGTMEIAEDPNSTGRGNALKFTITRSAAGHLLFGLPIKPGLGTVNGTNALEGVDGFKVTNGNKYHISFDVYCEASDEGFGGAGYLCYLSNEAGIGATSGTGTSRVNLSKDNTSGAGSSTVSKNAGKGYWSTFEYDITATTNISGLEYLLLGFAVAENKYTSADEGHDDYSVIVYFDNIVVTDVTGITSNFVGNAKRSIRAESTDGETYVSAGIRFRGEIATATADAAEEVGFIVAPEALVNAYIGTNAWYTMVNGAPALATAKTVDATRTLYGTSGGTNNQYQLLISGLTKENETANLKNMYFTVMMYLKDANGNYTYYNVATSSYREVQNVYIAKDQSNDSKY